MSSIEESTDQYLNDFRMLANVIFALCMFSSVFNIEFTDAGMAEPDLVAVLRQNLGAILNFIVAFIFLAMYWIKFIGKLYFTKFSNAKMLTLWLMYLAVVCLYPFAENLLGNYPGSVYAQVVFSGLWAVIGLVGLMNWGYAYAAGLTDPDMPPMAAKRLLYESFPEPILALLSIPVAFYSALGYYLVMLAIIPINLYISRKFAD